MALADDLVQAAAKSSWPGPPEWDSPLLDTLGLRVRHLATTRAAIEGALSHLRAEGYRYLVSARTDGPRRLDIRRLASAVERGEDGT